MKVFPFLFTLFGLAHVANGQQIFDRSDFRDLSFTWNPAMTATQDYWEAFADYRRQWAGFEGSPRTASIGVSYPFVDYNMSIGGYFMHDQVQPLQNTTIGGNYAYHIDLGIFRGDRLSIGISGIINQVNIDALDFVVVDPDDVNIPIGEQSQINFNAGIGFHYVSNASSNYLNSGSYFFMGAAVNQGVPNQINLTNGEEPIRFDRVIHGNALVGGHIITDYFFIEPYVWVNYAYPGIYNGKLGVVMEIYDVAWGGLSYASNNAVAIQAGYILKGGFLDRDGALRIGIQATVNTGSIGKVRGLSYESYVAYRFQL